MSSPQELFFKTRLSSFQKKIAVDEAYLIANPHHIQYLTGFVSLVPEEREALLVITNTHVYVLHAAFSPLHKVRGISYYQGVFVSKITTHLETLFSEENKTLTTIKIDEDNLFVSELRAIETFSTKHQIVLAAADLHQLEQQRMVKDNQEIEYLRQAGRTAKKAWDDFLPQLQPGITEEQARQKLEQLLLKHGSQRPAFPTIIAFGPHGALPHHQPTETVLQNNTPVLVDFGATVHNYRSDMTRTVWVGNKPSSKFLLIETIVKNAYQAALAAAKVGASALEIDAAAREHIKKEGYANQFFHTTGHGVGLDIHEQPSLNWTNIQKMKPGFAITIEPGIYLEGAFGYRHENTVIINKNDSTEITALK
jgi:Xaa-Pro aminopeptidase